MIEWLQGTQRETATLPALGKAVAAGFVAGVCIALWAPALPPGWMRWGLLLVGLLMWWRGRRLRCLGALLAAIGWAALHAGWTLDAQLPQRLEGSETTVTGTVVSLPEIEPRRTRFRFRVDAEDGQPAALRGRQLQLAWYDDFSADQPGPRMQLGAGARWRFTLRLRAPRGLANPGGFDAERHALSQRIAATGLVRPATAQQLAAAAGLQAWRERMAARIGEAVGQRSARYVQALAVGDTRALDDGD